ncbi:MAG: hypothetical protein AB4080_19100 [Trichodesmium sp.]
MGIGGVGSVGSMGGIIVLEKEEVQRFIPLFCNIYEFNTQNYELTFLLGRVTN